MSDKDLREGIPQPQRLSREQLIEKVREHFKGLDYPTPEEIADFALSLDVTASRGQFVAELLGLWEKALCDGKIRQAYKGAWQEIKTAISVLAKTYSADELDVTPSGDGQKAPVCELCGLPMPKGEEMFKYHGHSGPCPAPPAEQSR